MPRFLHFELKISLIPNGHYTKRKVITMKNQIHFAIHHVSFFKSLNDMILSAVIGPLVCVDAVASWR